MERNHPVSAEYLLSKESVEFSKSKRTLLHDCCKHGMARFAQSLCDNGVDVNCIDEETGRTPLMEACLSAMSEAHGRFKKWKVDELPKEEETSEPGEGSENEYQMNERSENCMAEMCSENLQGANILWL